MVLDMVGYGRPVFYGVCVKKNGYAYILDAVEYVWIRLDTNQNVSLFLETFG